MNKETVVYLTQEDAEKFALFLKHYGFFTPLIQDGLLNMNNGNVILNINNGIVAKVTKEEVVYKK